MSFDGPRYACIFWLMRSALLATSATRRGFVGGTSCWLVPNGSPGLRIRGLNDLTPLRLPTTANRLGQASYRRIRSPIPELSKMQSLSALIQEGTRNQAGC